MLRIAHHTTTQNDVRQEIGANSDSEEEYEEYLRQDSTLLAACILESSRLHPILRKRAIPLALCILLTVLIAFSNPESALTDKTVGDFKILRNVWPP